MATKEQWIEFVHAMRRRQDQLSAEARPFEEGKIFIGIPSPNRDVDITKAHIQAIKGEIASLEKTIHRVDYRTRSRRLPGVGIDAFWRYFPCSSS